MTSPLDRALARLIAAAEGDSSTPDDFQAAFDGVGDALGVPTQATLDHALKTIAPHVTSAPHPQRAGYAAVFCGGLVEHGGDPTIALPFLLDRIARVAPGASLFVAACEKRAAAAPPKPPAPKKVSSDEEDDGDDEEEMDPAARAVEEFGEEVGEEDPDLAAAWAGLDMIGRAAVASLIKAPAARIAAGAREDLSAPIAKLADVHPWAMWLDLLFKVPHEEPLLVLHPALEKGFLVRVSGVADNFQLHTLLADALIGDEAEGFLPGVKPTEAVVSLARGDEHDHHHAHDHDCSKDHDHSGHDHAGHDHDCATDHDHGGEPAEAASGVWNLVGWRGVSKRSDQPEATAPTHWVWGEGTFQEIEPFEGIRVVLLGKPPYERSWNAHPRFCGLAASVTIEKKLTVDEVRAAIAKIARAAHS